MSRRLRKGKYEMKAKDEKNEANNNPWTDFPNKKIFRESCKCSRK